MTKSKKKVHLYLFPDGTFKVMCYIHPNFVSFDGVWNYDIDGELYAYFVDETGHNHIFETPTLSALRLKLRRFFTKHFADEIV